MKRNKLRQLFFVVGDGVLLVIGFMFVFALRKRTPFFPPLQDFSFYFPFLYFYLISFLGIFSIFNLYGRKRPQFSLSHLTDYIRALSWWSFGVIVFSFVAQANYSRVLLIYALVPGIVLPFFWRLFVVRFLPQSVQREESEEVFQNARSFIERTVDASRELDLVEGLQGGGISHHFYRVSKRTADLVAAAGGLIILSPAFVAISLLIRKDGPGRAILKQERVGQYGKKFFIYKFRTMDQSTPLYAPGPRRESDERVTRIGRFLRRYSLDELPQLWNVLRGEMSIVGPRPEMPFLVVQHNEWQKMRLSVKPGITGLWQILGRKDIPLSENLEYDFYYIHHQSFLMDLVIMLKTIPAIILGRGAY
ncbi:MAG: sugar transferase [Patescibacteria group bacterium]